MKLPKFKYLAPRTISEACSLLTENRGKSELIAGGTDLLVSMKQKVKIPEYMIDLAMIPELRYIEQNGQEIKIGAMTLISELEQSDTIKRLFPVLAEAAQCVAIPNLRNMGTLGGNICLDTRCRFYNKSDMFRKSFGACLKCGGDVCKAIKGGKRCFAIFQADTVPALIALKAKVKIASPDGEQILPLEDIYRDDGRDYLKLKEADIITEVQIPNPPAGSGGAYEKLRIRKSFDFAVISAAANLKLKNGICEDIRIVLGSAGSCPIRVVKAEETIKGRNVTDAVVEEAAEFAYQAAKPVANMVNVLPSYRREMAREVVIRAVMKALSRSMNK